MTIYGPDLELANRLRFWLNPIGVNVVEIAGWRTHGRTYATFNPYGSVNHHTAGSRLGVAPSLGICINGRAGLPGPLCNVHQQRDDVVNVVAAGVANHAGGGGWQGLKGNQSVFGLEVEHCGYADEPFSERRLDVSCRVHAAFISGLSRPDAAMQCQHFEWSNEGKIDFVRALLPGGAAGFRFRVAKLLASGPGQQPPQKPEDDEVATHIVKGDKSPEWWHTDLLTRKVWIPSANAAAQIIWCTAVAGGKVSHNPDNGPITIEQAMIDKIPDIAKTP